MSDPMRRRSLHVLLRRRDPGQTPYRPITAEMEADLLRWAASLDDETLLDMRGAGPAMLRWIRDHQPATPPPANTNTALAEVMQRTAWHVEVFWNGGAGWFTARLVDFFGHLEPPDRPIAAIGDTPGEAMANLHDAVLAWDARW